MMSGMFAVADRLQDACHLVAVHAGHHDVEQDRSGGDLAIAAIASSPLATLT
jgi:hypothetical protein